MVSITQQTERIRKRKARNTNVRRRRAMRASGTPPFPIQPEGYNPAAADAKPTAEPKAEQK